MIKSLRKVAGASLQVRKDAISIFASDELETRLKELIEIHCALCRLSVSVKSSGAIRLQQRNQQISPPFGSVARAPLRPAKTGTACDLFRFGLSEFERQL